MHVGGKAKKVTIGGEICQLVEIVRPKLVADGLFLVGLDIVNNKLLEVNVFSPGGLYSCCELQQTDFTQPIIDAMQAKVEYRKAYPNTADNALIATL